MEEAIVGLNAALEQVRPAIRDAAQAQLKGWRDIELQARNSIRMARARSKTCAAAIAAMMFVSQAAIAECPPHYTVDVVEGPPCGLTQGYAHGRGISPEGAVCGAFGCPGGQEDAFVSGDGVTLTPLSFPPGTSTSRANSIVGKKVSGWYVLDSTGLGNLGFLLDGDSFTAIWPLDGGNWVEPYGMTSTGVVVGDWGNIVSGPFIFPRAFRWENGTMQDLAIELPMGPYSEAFDISENGLITGWMGTAVQGVPTYHAFIWNNGKVTDLGTPLPDCFATEGRGINNKGQVCGIWWKPSPTYPYWDRRGFFYDGMKMIDIGTLYGLPEVFPQDVNEDGVVVGYVAQHAGGRTACIWHGGALYNLNSLVPAGTTLNFLYYAYRINDSGLIVGAGLGTNQHGVAVRLTPEPVHVGDVNCDQIVNVGDLLAVINNWGPCAGNCAPDLNHDGIVNHEDLMIVISNWG